jgi:tRNA nucleotidyltransferase (CCA-adding enzyme)
MMDGFADAVRPSPFCRSDGVDATQCGGRPARACNPRLPAIPDEVQYIIDTFENNGCEAYAVGGCVRDSLLGKAPQDWDVCTPARPEQTIEYFAGRHIAETGLRHGTLTLMLNHKPFEITTYRIDGVYTDNRHPDKVEFTDDLREDLSRRDFTINAMAYNPKRGVVDLFGGVKDLNSGIIKCVGDANKRFQEDALRIMRALRFASVLGFSIDDGTSKAMIDNKNLLNNISVERIAIELNKFITGNGVRNILLKYISIITEIIPEMSPVIGFEQNNPYHCYDVFNHILFGVENAPRDVDIRLTMLFHDIGKPECYTETDGTGHFYGHSRSGSDLAKKILLRLKYDRNTVETVTKLILYHDVDIHPRGKYIKRWLNKIGEKRFRQLLEVKRADAMAHSPGYRQKKLDEITKILTLINEIIEQKQCFSLKDLAVKGADLIALGIPEGVRIGIILNQLMNMVIDERVENDKVKLLEGISFLNLMQDFF